MAKLGLDRKNEFPDLMRMAKLGLDRKNEFPDLMRLAKLGHSIKIYRQDPKLKIKWIWQSEKITGTQLRNEFGY